jgi:hypothetical protein
MLGVGLLGASLQGCGGGGGHPPSRTCNLAGQIHTTWAIHQAGQTVECLPGDQVLMRVDDDSMVFTFDCIDHEGLTTGIESDFTHNVAFQLQDGNGNVLSQTPSMALYVPCGAVQDTPLVIFSLASP